MCRVRGGYLTAPRRFHNAAQTTRDLNIADCSVFVLKHRAPQPFQTKNQYTDIPLVTNPQVENMFDAGCRGERVANEFY